MEGKRPPALSLLGALKTAALVLVGGYLIFTLLLKLRLLVVFGIDKS